MTVERGRAADVTPTIAEQIAWARREITVWETYGPGPPPYEECEMLRAVLATLEGFDARVSELLAANSAEVERRREAERTTMASVLGAPPWSQLLKLVFKRIFLGV